jgi:hypothetical protein
MADEGKEKPAGSKMPDAQSPPAMPAAAARPRQRAPALTKPIVKLPTKLVRQCGRCGEFCSVMVEPGETPPEFKCKSCDAPARRG